MGGLDCHEAVATCTTFAKLRRLVEKLIDRSDTL